MSTKFTRPGARRIGINVPAITTNAAPGCSEANLLGSSTAKIGIGMPSVVWWTFSACYAPYFSSSGTQQVYFSAILFKYRSLKSEVWSLKMQMFILKHIKRVWSICMGVCMSRRNMAKSQPITIPERMRTRGRYIFFNSVTSHEDHRKTAVMWCVSLKVRHRPKTYWAWRGFCW